MIEMRISAIRAYLDKPSSMGSSNLWGVHATQPSEGPVILPHPARLAAQQRCSVLLHTPKLSEKVDCRKTLVMNSDLILA
ncbi:hypothetical protein LSTR_LSTR014243 [Laodelphax striatellus]|uniref:Uncharacterized protein n=1 Tax=Laodelphax striatellus TaxID=195883 RepID=A0A482WVN4_LAOST|nr:hypothetical protein LSTR_LSTR016836 [Laodelphax striatellus]RZF37205.1 hypothetical protein LSTR_LSTR014243 [Laodelphax striatellus]